MDKILVVCSSEKGKKVYTDNLKDMGYISMLTLKIIVELQGEEYL